MLINKAYLPSARLSIINPPNASVLVPINVFFNKIFTPYKGFPDFLSKILPVIFPKSCPNKNIGNNNVNRKILYLFKADLVFKKLSPD